MRQDWESTLGSELPQALERALHSAFATVPTDQTWILDHLHLPLGTLRPPWTVRQWEEALTHVLRSTLAQAQPLADPSTANQSAEPSMLDPTTSARYTAHSETGQRAELLLHYLNHGRFPWWQSETVALPTLHKWLEEAIAPTVPQRSRWAMSLNRTHFRTRLTHQFPQAVVWRLIAQVWPEQFPEEIRELFEQAFPASTPLPKALHTEWLTLLAQTADLSVPFRWIQLWSVQLKQSPRGPEAVARLSAVLPEQPTTSALATLARWLTPSSGSSASQALATEPNLSSPAASSASPDSISLATPSFPTKNASAFSDRASQAYDFAPSTPGKGWQDPGSYGLGEGATVETIAVDHAGIILLWPFLAQLFASQGWLADEEFGSQTDQMAAMVLLHWLATGEEAPSEAQLVLGKWLVGWPLDAPVPDLAPPTKAAKAEGEKVLLAVIDYWKKMQNSSPEGLRQAFLQRPGYLSPEEHSWALALESETHDVLLNYLPWGLGVVRLPWLSTTLDIQW
ncbi:MAG TPA: hypothetical protein DCR93_20625 [Cytophagales bacterium]|nr:hypothetical protein [Cytophagales bacterium]